MIVFRRGERTLAMSVNHCQLGAQRILQLRARIANGIVVSDQYRGPEIWKTCRFVMFHPALDSRGIPTSFPMVQVKMWAYFVRRVHKLSLPLSIELSAEYSALSSGLLGIWIPQKGDGQGEMTTLRGGDKSREVARRSAWRIDDFEERVRSERGRGRYYL